MAEIASKQGPSMHLNSKYTIVVPTRNRPTVAIRSLRMIPKIHAHDDVTVILSDNSDREDPQLRHYCEQNEIVYIRPSEVLSMTAHWDWILKTVEWEAITFVADRTFLLEDAFLQMIELSDRSQLSVVFGMSSLAEKAVSGLTVWKFSGRRSQWKIHHLCGRQAANSIANNFNIIGIPKLLSTVLRRADWEKVLAKFPRTLTSFGPDSEFAFKLILGFPESEFMFWDRIGSVSHTQQLSNSLGALNPAKSKTFQDFVRLSKVERLEYSPYPDRITGLNSLVDEFNKVQAELGMDYTFTRAVVDRMQEKFDRQQARWLRNKISPVLGLADDEFAIMGVCRQIGDIPSSVFNRQYWTDNYRLPWD